MSPWHWMSSARGYSWVAETGQIVVLDSNTGKELQTLSIAGGIHDLIYDPITRRIYAAAKGVIDVFEQTDLNHYVSAEPLPPARIAAPPSW